MKSPQLQLKEAIFEINKIAFETGDEFRHLDAQLQNYIEVRNVAAQALDFEQPPEKRRELQKVLGDLDIFIAQAEESLRTYLDDYLKENRVEVESPDQEKLDTAFKQAHIAHERIYLLYKHTRPELVEGFLKIAFGTLDASEQAEFWENVHRREMDELDEILESVEADKTALQP